MYKDCDCFAEIRLLICFSSWRIHRFYFFENKLFILSNSLNAPTLWDVSNGKPKSELLMDYEKHDPLSVSW